MAPRFLTNYMSRVFDNPSKVFPDEILKPELQDLDSFADGIQHICEAQERVAKQYLGDGSLQLACPPLQALLSIMATGQWKGLTIDSPEVRQMFTRDYLLASDWYRDRLVHKQQNDIKLWQRKLDSLESCLADPSQLQVVADLDLTSARDYAMAQLAKVESPTYLEELVGTLGVDPMLPIDVNSVEPAALQSADV